MKIRISIACLAMALCFSTTQASDEDTPFAALQWTFGSETMKPDVIIGYRSVDVESDGDVSGWQGSVSYTPEGVDKLKLEVVKGDENMQGTFGGGYSLQDKQALVTAGANGRHIMAGVDYLITSHKVEPYVGITTLSDYDVPEAASSAATITSDSTNTQSYTAGENLQQEYFPEYTDCAC